MRVLHAVSCLERGDDEQKRHHGQSAIEERGTTAPGIDEKDGGEGADDVEDVLDGGYEEEVADAGALHHVDNVIHTEIDSRELRPHLNAQGKEDTVEHPWLGQRFECRISGFAFKRHGFLNLAILRQDFGMVDITVAMEIGQHVDRFFPAVLARQPAR